MRNDTTPAKASKALALLRQPGSKLVLLHERTGYAFYLWPRGGRITDEIAQALLMRGDVQPYESGLLPGHPQSWRLGNWRRNLPEGLRGRAS